MLEKTPGLFWHDIAGVYALADLPQYESVSSIAKSTGWWELDQIFKLYPGQFVVVHGATNHGKSTFLMNLICNQFITNGTKTFAYLPENERHIRERLGMIWGDRAGSGWDAFSEIGLILASAIRRYDEQPHDLMWILGKYLECKADGHNAELIVLDPWNEIEWTRPKELPLTEFIGQCLKQVTGFCREHAVTVILSAHPTKAGVADGKVPGPYDIDGSAHWANKPDNVLCVYRDPKTDAVSIVSQKVREIGAGKRGVCYFTVDEETGIFTPQHGAVSI
jgi:twinkle protein